MDRLTVLLTAEYITYALIAVNLIVFMAFWIDKMLYGLCIA